MINWDNLEKTVPCFSGTVLVAGKRASSILETRRARQHRTYCDVAPDPGRVGQIVVSYITFSSGSGPTRKAHHDHAKVSPLLHPPVVADALRVKR